MTNDRMGGISIGVDVGGTFTDVLAFDKSRGTFRAVKVPSTPEDQSKGFVHGIEAVGADLAHVDEVVHGTTVATNAVLERKGARCGLITTRGFRDLLELGRRTRPQPYGMFGYFEPLIDRELRREVTERMSAQGDIVRPLDESEVSEVVRELIEAGTEALVIHFLHSYANPIHEQRCAAIACKLWPNPFVTTGSGILAEMREFERGSTAAINGYVQPRMSRYIGNIARRLVDNGLASELLVTQSNGGAIAASLVTDHAVRTVLSGPAAGAIAAAEIARQAGYPDVITGDMGGTSFDAALIIDGTPAISADKDIAYGLPIRVPMVDIHTIGAGGGSIARVNSAGLLQIGPESAGSFPGPIGYGRGGTEPTITDANLLLGRLNPQNLTGARPADLGAIERVIAERIGCPLGLSVMDAAAAMVRIADIQMAAALRLVSVERGHDPRRFAYLPFGGAGPLHAVALARELGIPTVIVPRFPGLTSALGCLLANLRHDFVQTINRPLDEVTAADMDHVLSEQRAAGERLLERESASIQSIEVRAEAELHYQGQIHMLGVPVQALGADPVAIGRAFEMAFKARFAIELPTMTVVVANLRTAIFGRRAPIDLMAFAPKDHGLPQHPAATRPVWFAGSVVPTPVYRREDLAIGVQFRGPAIVEQMDTTVVLDPATSARVDRLGNLVLSLDPEGNP